MVHEHYPVLRMATTLASLLGFILPITEAGKIMMYLRDEGSKRKCTPYERKSMPKEQNNV